MSLHVFSRSPIELFVFQDRFFKPAKFQLTGEDAGKQITKQLLPFKEGVTAREEQEPKQIETTSDIKREIPSDSVFQYIKVPVAQIKKQLAAAGGSWTGCQAMHVQGGHIRWDLLKC